MKTEAPLDPSAVKIIEIIDDGIDPFGDRPQNTTIQDAGGPRWVGPTAAAALVALIGYGIATSASTSSVPKVAPALSTTASPTTITKQSVPLPTTIPPPVVPYYSADPPREYQVRFAEIGIENQPPLFPGDYQLWAMPGSTATSGSWFSIESLRSGPQQTYAVDALRVSTAGQVMVISHIDSGQSRIHFSIDNMMSVWITAFGWDDEDLVRLAQSVTISDRSNVGNEVRPSDPTLIGDFHLLSLVQPYLAVLGEPTEQVYYSVGSDPSRGFSLGVSEIDPASANFAARPIALRFFLDRMTPFDVDQNSAVAGAIVGQPGQAAATWIADDHMVSLVGTMSVPEVITLARTVHQVSRENWDGMRFQTSVNADGSTGGFVQTQARAASFGTDADGEQWIINVGMATFAGDKHEVDWQWPPGGGFGSLAAETAWITTVVDGGRTYVLAELPRTVAPTAQLQVLRTGLDPVLVPFNDTDASLDRTFGAFAFSEPIDYTAQIIGPDGAVLATWPLT